MARVLNPRPGDDRSVPELFSEMTSEFGDLVRREVDLAKAEVKEQLGTATKAGAMFTATGVLGFLALQVLTIAAALGLAAVLPDALAFALVGIVYLVVAGLALAKGKRNLSEFKPVPEQTIQTIKEDIQVAKSSLARGVNSDGQPGYARPWATRTEQGS
jgi:hypothetical protein